MKNTLIITLGIAAMMISCGPKPDGKLGDLMARKDSLEKVKAKVLSELDAVQHEIAKIDTTIKRRYVNVTISQLKKQPFQHEFEVHGVVEADQSVEVYPEMNGRIKSVAVREGQKVSAGQVLARLNTDVLVNQRKEVQASYDLAKDLFERQRTLWEKDKIGSEVEYLQAKNRKESLESSLNTIDAQIAMSVVKAPHDGVVDDVFMKTGEMATPAFPIVRLVNTNQVYIETEISEEYVGKVAKGTRVSVRFPSINYSVDTSIAYVGNFIDPGNRTFKAIVNLANKDGMLKPNLLATMGVVDFKRESEYVIPSKAVMQDTKGNSYVYVAVPKEGEMAAKKVFLEIGKSNEDGTLILSGLEGDEKVIIKGARIVTDGEYIKIKS